MLFKILQFILLNPNRILLVILLGSDNLLSILVTTAIVFFIVLLNYFFEDVSEYAGNTVHKVFAVDGLFLHNGYLWFFIALDIVKHLVVGHVKSLHVLIKSLILIITERKFNFLDRELDIETLVQTVKIKHLIVDAIGIDYLVFEGQVANLCVIFEGDLLVFNLGNFGLRQLQKSNETFDIKLFLRFFDRA